MGRKTKTLYLGIIGVITLFTVWCISSHISVFKTQEVWPDFSLKPNYENLVEQSILKYNQQGQDYKGYLSAYKPFGDYLNYGTQANIRKRRNDVKFDADGLPLIKYKQDYYYNPVAIAQYALSMHGKYLRGENTLEVFNAAVIRLLAMQDKVGAFRYPFAFRYYLTGEVYQPGWVSGMAQGQALSVLARAYHLTKDRRYLKAGNAALQFLLTPVENGGVMSTLEYLHPSLKDYITFEEYIAKPSSYTLNGFMFTLLGLYDWWQINPKEIVGSHKVAKQYFYRGIDTLKHTLPYYDLGGFTAYDLGHIIYNRKPRIGINYHNVHIYLLHALNSITGDLWFNYFKRIWISYVE
jgi:hypothetical protein